MAFWSRYGARPGPAWSPSGAILDPGRIILGGGAGGTCQTPVGGIQGGVKTIVNILNTNIAHPSTGPLRGPDVNSSRFAATRPDMELIAESP